MALIRVAQYNSTPTVVEDYQAQNAHLQAFTNQLLTQQFILDSGTDQPVIKQGTYVSHGGSLYVADADTSITGSPSDGSVYIRVSGTTSLTVEFINDISGYTWNPVYTALTSGSYTLLPYLIVKASTVWTRYNFNPNNQSFGDTRVNSLAATGAIYGASLGTTGSAYVGGILGVTGAISGASLGVTGAISGASVGVTGSATVGDTLGASNAIITGTLGVIGAISGESVGVTGNATVGGTLGFASLNPDNSTETSVQLSAGDSQVLPKGAYAMILGASVECQMKYGSDWVVIFANPGGFVISDGVNFRLINTATSGTYTIGIRKW